MSPQKMNVGIPKETAPHERRVAASPDTVQRLRKLGLDVLVQAGAGVESGFPDEVFIQAGARIVLDARALYAESDLLLKVRPPTPAEADLVKPGAVRVGFFWPAQNKPLIDRLAARKVTVLAMDAVPRITRAQRMDALSAMANIAGYRAVLEAANHFDRFIPGQITAAGRALGAVVSAVDTREAVREQVASLGASFIAFDFKEEGEGAGGYAKEMSAAYLAAEQALIATHAEQADIVIWTALIRGKPAPQLITSGAVVAMPEGSIIVDMAAEQGGNCPLTERDKVVVKHGVTIIGYTDLPSRMARQSSELYATTVTNLVESLFDKDKRFFIDVDDEIHRGALVLKDGALMWPPPARPKPAVPAPAPKAEKPDVRTAPAGAAAHAAPAKKSGLGAKIALAVLIALFAAAGLAGPPEFLQHLTVFLLACVIGYHVVWSVTPALHTPLMSVTNAISGILQVGGMVALGSHAGQIANVLAEVAILLAAISVAGGFLVTQRMLRMFRK